MALFIHFLSKTAMIWKAHYLAPDPTQWKGRADTPPASYFFQAMHILNLLECLPTETSEVAFGLIGFRCDEGIQRNHGRIGAAEGPTAIRHALARLPLQKQTAIYFDVGNIICSDDNLEASQHALGEVVSIVLQQRINPIVIGGGHELAWGHYQGIAQVYPDKHLGIIHFGSRFNMQPLLSHQHGTSSSSFLQIAEAHRATKRRLDYNCIGIQHAANIRQLHEIAKSYDTKIIWADELHQGQQEKVVDFIDRVIDQNEIIYVSLCLDVFSSAYAPGVNATQVLGLSPWHIIPLIRKIAASGKVICYDIAEMSPRYDFDHHTAKLAANLIYEFIHHYHEPRHLW
jgi:formiminoglutamase